MTINEINPNVEVILPQTQTPAEEPVFSPVEQMAKKQLQEPGGQAPINRAEKINVDDLRELIDSLNKILEKFYIQARFSVHETTKDIMVRIMNVQTNKLIREIPPKKILDMVAKMMELVGLLFDEKA